MTRSRLQHRELLLRITKNDFDIGTFRSGGPGGQHQNKTDSGVRITHRASGAIGESRSDRSQLTNKKLAFERLVESPKFRIWLNRRILEILEGETIDQKVDKLMQPDNLVIEGVDPDSKKWVSI